MECKRCHEDLSSFMDFDFLGATIECPKCGHKMEVNYDSVYDDAGDEFEWFYVESCQD